MFCSKCGKQVNEGARFCPGCGTGMQAETVVVTPQAAPAQQAPKGKRNLFPLIIGGICGLIIIGFVIFYLTQRTTITGTFTITGIPSQYNGKYIMIEEGWDELADNIHTRENGVDIFGAQNIDLETGSFTMSRIQNGRASIPVWNITNLPNLAKYTGNHTIVYMDVLISNSNARLFDEIDLICGISFENIVFSNGSATVAFNNGKLYTD